MLKESDNKRMRNDCLPLTPLVGEGLCRQQSSQLSWQMWSDGHTQQSKFTLTFTVLVIILQLSALFSLSRRNKHPRWLKKNSKLCICSI